MVVTKNIELFKQDNMYTYITLNNMFNFLSDLILGCGLFLHFTKVTVKGHFFYNFFHSSEILRAPSNGTSGFSLNCRRCCVRVRWRLNIRRAGAARTSQRGI